MDYETTIKEQEAELQREIDAFIAHDQSLTPEQRVIERNERRVRRFKRTVITLNRLIAADAPPAILTRNIQMLERQAWRLWPEAMSEVTTEHKQYEVRKANRQCVLCAAELPLPIDLKIVCSNCESEEDYECE